MSSTSPLHAHFFGTADGSTSAKRDHSGILLQAEGASLLLDCGAAAERHLVAGGFPVDVPQALWLSHMHNDHIGQVGMLLQSLWLRQRREPVHLFGPQAVLDAMREWLPRCLLFPELLAFSLEYHAVRPGDPVTHGPFTLTAFATEHLTNLASQFRATYPATCFDCYGVAVDWNGRRYVYSSDLAHPREMAPALAGRPIQALICELAHFPERELFRELLAYDVRTLYLTHYGDEWEGRDKELTLAAHDEKFRGTVRLLQDRVAIEL